MYFSDYELNLMVSFQLRSSKLHEYMHNDFKCFDLKLTVSLFNFEVDDKKTHSRLSTTHARCVVFIRLRCDRVLQSSFNHLFEMTTQVINSLLMN